MFEVSQLLLPVDDIDASLSFYEKALGLAVAFRDGDRYAAVRAGAVKVALVAAPERRPDQGAAAAFKVESLEAVIEHLAANGLPVPEIAEGAHERVIELHDPDGHAVVFYEPLPAS